MRRTKASLAYRRPKNLRAVQFLPGHSKLERTAAIWDRTRRLDSYPDLTVYGNGAGGGEGAVGSWQNDFVCVGGFFEA